MAFRVGIDIGSTATKACVLQGQTIVYTLVIPTGYSSVDASQRVLEDLAAHGYPHEQCCYVAATGYGRVAVPFAQKTITEITCHGKGAAQLFGPDCVVVDIGGQDTKSIVLKNGKVTDFRMNDKCSAGTGKFLEIMANRLGLSQTELTDLAQQGKPTTISSMCTVFAESEVISLIGSGQPREDICWGIVESVVKKVAPLVPASPTDTYVLTGGLCENDYIVERLAKTLNGTVETCALARFAGALGAALSLPLDCQPTSASSEPADGEAAPAESAASQVDAPVGFATTAPQAATQPQETASQEATLQEGQLAKGESHLVAEPQLVVTFKTTTQALAFETLCKSCSLPGRLAPLPEQVSAGCGYAWIAPLTAKDQLAEAAAQQNRTFEQMVEVTL